jgi:hypothetical protein
LTAIRGLTSQQFKSPSVVGSGRLWLSDAYMGGIAEAAVDWKGPCYGRKMGTEGYRNSLKIDGELDAEASVDEYIPKFKNPADAPKTGFTMAVEETPELPTAGKWISVKAHGAKGDGTTDDTAAIQKAIDVDEPIVYLPHGRYRIDGVVKLRGNLRRLCGMSSTIDGAGKGPMFRLEDGKPTTVTIERLNCEGVPGSALFEQASSRTWVLRSISAKRGFYGAEIADPKLFLEDVRGPSLVCKGGTIYGRGVSTTFLGTGDAIGWWFGLESALVPRSPSRRSEFIGNVTTFDGDAWLSTVIFGEARIGRSVSRGVTVDGLYAPPSK